MKNEGRMMEKKQEQANMAPPSRGLSIKLVWIGLAVAIVGAIISGDFVKPWVGPYFPGLGYALVDVGLGAFLVFIFIERLLSRERSIVQDRERRLWDTVREKVEKLVSAELAGITSEIINVTNASQVTMANLDATNEQLEEQERNATLKEMQKMAEDAGLLRTSIGQAALSLLDGQYGELFLQRAERLGNLQLRYWSHFLEPKTVAYLIDLEQSLRTLDLHTRIVARQRQSKTQQGTLAAKLSEMYVDEVYNDVKEILGLIVKGVRENLVKIP
jgi:hypothetical protein